MDMLFSEKLYALRKASNMTQITLAEKLNVSRQAVSRWEQGTAMPDIDNLLAMSDLFGVSVDELLRDQPAQAQNTETEAEASSTDEGDLAFNRLVNWIRLDVYLAAIGLAFHINAAILGYIVGKELAYFSWIGIALLALSALLAVILFFAFRVFKKKYD